MADISDFKRGHIVGARMAGASVRKITVSFSVAMGTVLKVMTAFEKERKTSSLKQKWKLSDKDRRILTWIVKKDHKNTVRKELQKVAYIYIYIYKGCSTPYWNKFVWNF